MLTEVFFIGFFPFFTFYIVEERDKKVLGKYFLSELFAGESQSKTVSQPREA